MKPVASVLLVSDYGAGDTIAWDDLRETIDALLVQTFPEEFEIVVIESRRYRDAVPADLLSLDRKVRWVFADTDTSFGLKNAGVDAAAADIVGILDADCTPAPEWLAALVATLRSRPEAVAVSGRTIHQETTLTARVLAMLSRGYLDRGAREARTWTIANQNCGLRRDVLRKHPFPANWNAFGGEAHAAIVRRSGGELWFNPAMLASHTFSGWRAERDIRKNRGHATVRCRLENEEVPHGWLVRLGPLSVPALFLARLVHDLATFARVGRHYRVRFFEAPAVLGFSFALHCMEIPGMREAMRGRALGGASRYR